jgi:hypothetical protein
MRKHDMGRNLIKLVMVVALIGTVVMVSGFKSDSKSPYVGVWKLEKNSYDGEKWKGDNSDTIMKILPNGHLKIIMFFHDPHPNPPIDGTWKILDDGRLQISEEAEGGKPFQEGPSISKYIIQNGKLISKPEPFMPGIQKATIGHIYKKVGK